MHTPTGTRAAPSAGAPPREWSAWVDAATGVREEAGFIGERGSRRFGVLHSPPGEALGGLVICCPLQAELLRNYRREVLMGRRLAVRGVAVQRFHYRGAGHSDGETSAATFETMIEDALAAADHLAATAGVTRVAFMGARFGGLVAATAAGERGADLALWEPVHDPARYFDEVLRFRLMRDLKDGDGAAASSAEGLLAELRASGSVDVLGHTLERSLYESALGHSLVGSIGAPTGALLIQIGVGRGLRREHAEVALAWRERGIEVETHVVPDREAWWLSGDLWPVHETHRPTRRLIELTADWATRRLGRKGRLP